MKHFHETVVNNYDKVFSHFKEQDQLRNTAFGFFMTITTGVSAFLSDGEQGENIWLYFGLFILGFLFMLLFYRYKYYGNMYEITMKVLRALSIMNDDCTQEDIKVKIEQTVNETANNIKLKFYSADFIICACLTVVNLFNLYRTVTNIPEKYMVYITKFGNSVVKVGNY